MTATSSSRVRTKFGAAREGNVAMLWALCAAIIISMIGLGVDFARAQSLRAQMQNAADGAALVAERSSSLPMEQRAAAARAFFDEALGGQGMTGELSFAVTQLDEGGHRVAASLKMDLGLARLISPEGWRVAVQAEALSANSPNIEVALILDTTGSMAGQKIIDLRAAANALVGEVVQEDQSPYYSRVAIVPYSMAVNVGDLANDVRGSIAAAKAITNAVRSSGNVTITSPGHGFTNGQYVYITGVGGITQLNNKAWAISNVTANTFRVSGVSGTSGYTGGGSAYCTTAGCQYYRFTNYEYTPAVRIHQISTCVTERTGANAYTDVAPSTAWLGRNYPSTSNPCPSGNVITPLTSNTSLLTSRINALQASGSTAGHIGIAWGWYLLSPNFGGLFSGEGVPGAYGDEEVRKIAVILTDGEYNSSYCNGVISGPTSTSGSGSNADKINCSAPNGHAYNQGEELCERMQQAGIEIYTVAFDFSNVPNPQAAEDLLEACATDANHQRVAESGQALVEVFRDIGSAIGRLRLTR